MSVTLVVTTKAERVPTLGETFCPITVQTQSGRAAEPGLVVKKSTTKLLTDSAKVTSVFVATFGTTRGSATQWKYRYGWVHKLLVVLLHLRPSLLSCVFIATIMKDR